MPSALAVFRLITGSTGSSGEADITTRDRAGGAQGLTCELTNIFEQHPGTGDIGVAAGDPRLGLFAAQILAVPASCVLRSGRWPPIQVPGGKGSLFASLVSVAKLVDSERGQVSYADFIGTTAASCGWICKRFSRHFRCGSTFRGAVVRGVAMRTAVCFAASPVSYGTVGWFCGDAWSGWSTVRR
jgi:hypothetical protein